MTQIIKPGVVPVCGGAKLIGRKLGGGVVPRPGYTGARIKLVPGAIDANGGYNRDAGQGLVDPATLGGVEIAYMASFGANFFNLRMGATGQSQLATSDHVLLNTPDGPLWKLARFDWSGTNLRYQGPDDDIAAQLLALVGVSIVVDVYWIE